MSGSVTNHAGNPPGPDEFLEAQLEQVARMEGVKKPGCGLAPGEPLLPTFGLLVLPPVIPGGHGHVGHRITPGSEARYAKLRTDELADDDLDVEEFCRRGSEVDTPTRSAPRVEIGRRMINRLAEREKKGIFMEN